MEEQAEEEAAPRHPKRWRQLAREVGSIVLGVLIALSIGEVADAVRWHVRLGRSETAMRIEMAGNRFNLAERWLLRPCVNRRLDEIQSLITAAEAGAPLPVIATIGRLPARVSERAAFDVALSEGVLLHTDVGTARDIALAYDVTVDDFAQQIAAEQSAWTTLTMIERAAGPLDGDTILALRQAIAQARAAAAAIDMSIARSDKLLGGAGVPIEYGQYRTASGLEAALRASSLCRPLR